MNFALPKSLKSAIACPDVELEAFVHGSICIAYSGRCLMSQYMSKRDANQGVCDNSCRYSFGVYESSPRRMPNISFRTSATAEFYRIDEDENGTFLMNAKDLCLIEHLKELRDAGVCSFKVVGRTKSSFYVSMGSRTYRRAIDDLTAERPFDPALLQDLELMASRGFHKGFFNGPPGADGQEYDKRDRTQQSAVCGMVHGAASAEGVWLDVRGKLSVGDEMDVITPSTRSRTIVRKLRDKSGLERDTLHSGMGLCYAEFGSVLAPRYFRLPNGAAHAFGVSI